MADRPGPIFTPRERAACIRELIAVLRGAGGVEGVVALGSIANGSMDRHSDVDLAVALAPGAASARVAAECTQLVLATLPVFHYFSQSLGEIEFRGFLLDNFLEIDLGFMDADEVGAVTALPEADAAAKLDFIWHDVIHAAVALDRGHPWRALWYVDRLRNGALELAGGRLGLEMRHFKEVDRLPPKTLAVAGTAIAAHPTAAQLWPALRAATSALFAEGRATHPELADKLEAKLNRFLDLIQPTP